MEKALFNQVGEVKGKIAEGEDSFSFQFTPQNENLKRTRGALFTLVTVTGESSDKIEKAKAFYHAFQSSYYAKASGSIINGLSETLDHVEKEFSKEDETQKYSLVAAVFWGAVLYLAKTGNSSVFVSRAGKLKKLDFNKVASGVLEDQDTVCLASQKFADSIELEELGEIFNNEKFEAVLEKIDKKIAETVGAVCDVIRLSVNSPAKEAQPVTIGEVDEKGEVDMSALPGVEVAEEENPPAIGEDKEIESILDQTEPVPDSKTKILNNLLSRIKEFRQKLVPLVKDNLTPVINFVLKPWRKVPPGEHVDHVAIKRQRLLQIVVAILLVLSISITFGVISSNKNKSTEKINSLITSAKQNISEAANIKSIDPTRALSLVNKAKKDTDSAKDLAPKDPRISELEEQAAKLTAEINRTYSFDKLDTLADFSKINKDANIDRLALNDSTILATDEKSNKIYQVNISSKDLQEIEQQMTKPKNITGFPNGFYIQTSDGVTKLDLSNNATSAVGNSNWGDISGAANYESNLYLLDKGKNEIWKYVATSKGLASGKAYLVGEKPNLSQSSGITIDSYVWVVTKKGEIFKFALGKKQDFKLSNMQESFSNVVDIYTSTSAKNLYILDQGKARLVVISKDGVYQAQYSNDQLHQASSVVVLEEKKTAYLSVNGKILSVKLK